MSVTRRAVMAGLSAIAGVLAAALRGPPALPHIPKGEMRMRIACFIRYQIDPFQRDEFERYADAWAEIIPRCGGHLIGYFLPSEGTNDIGWGLIAFDSLAAYEAYRGRLRADPAARANFAFAQQKRFVLREERSFLEIVDSTFERAMPK